MHHIYRLQTHLVLDLVSYLLLQLLIACATSCWQDGEARLQSTRSVRNTVSVNVLDLGAETFLPDICQ